MSTGTRDVRRLREGELGTAAQTVVRADWSAEATPRPVGCLSADGSTWKAKGVAGKRNLKHPVRVRTPRR